MGVGAATGRGLTVTPGKAGAPRRRKPGMTENHRVLPRQCSPNGPPADVVTWRRCRLLEAGFPAALADRLAAGRIDLHALLQLVDRGCPPELAARLLAPLGPAGEELAP